MAQQEKKKRMALHYTKKDSQKDFIKIRIIIKIKLDPFDKNMSGHSYWCY